MTSLFFLYSAGLVGVGESGWWFQEGVKGGRDRWYGMVWYDMIRVGYFTNQNKSRKQTSSCMTIQYHNRLITTTTTLPPKPPQGPYHNQILTHFNDVFPVINDR